MKVQLNVLIGVLLFFSIISCDRRPLEDLPDSYQYAEIQLKVDWSKLEDQPPAEATALIYKYEENTEGKLVGNSIFRTVIISESNDCIIRLPEGVYSFIVYNDKPDEAATYTLHDYQTFENAKISLNRADKPSYDHPDAQVEFASCPELLAIDLKQKYIVTADMVKETRSFRSTKKSKPVDIIEFVPLQITRNVKVELEIEGLHNLSFADAISMGCYRDFHLSEELASEKTVNKFFQFSDKFFHPNDLYDGVIIGSFTTFGGGDIKGNNIILSKIKSDKSSKVKLTIFFVLKDKQKTLIVHEFDITDPFNQEGRKKHHIHLKLDQVIKLPDVEIEGGSDSGFNPDVDEWGDGEEVDVPVK